jgi:hypothetical protein
VQRQASEAFEAFEASAASAASAETEAFVESLVKREIGASEAFAAFGVFQETAASGKGKKAADLEAMSLLVRPVGSSIEANEAALGTRAS